MVDRWSKQELSEWETSKRHIFDNRTSLEFKRNRKRDKKERKFFCVLGRERDQLRPLIEPSVCYGGK